MNNPCSWCKQTSERIDSLEHQVENSIPISAIEKILDEWQINIDCADHYVIGNIWKICKRELDNLIKEAKG